MDSSVADYFLLFDEPRRPWLDPDLLKEKFFKLSANAHPDRVHQNPPAEREAAARQYAGLNAAYNCLRHTKDRIRHLLELESGAKPADIKTVVPEEMEMLFEVGKLCRQADKFLTENQTVTSPMLKVQGFGRAQELTGRLMELQQKIGVRIKALENELRMMNPAWESPVANGHPLARLDEIYRLLGYLGRWSEQLQEKIARLSF